jgi:hypothetical protein
VAYWRLRRADEASPFAAKVARIAIWVIAAIVAVFVAACAIWYFAV